MDPIKDFLEIIKPARAQVFQNLVLFPLLAPESGKPDYLTLAEALGGDAVVITEVSEDGQVVHLSVFDRPISEQEGQRFSRMGSFSNRRRNR